MRSLSLLAAAAAALAPPPGLAPLANEFATEKGGMRLRWSLRGSDSIEMELTLNGSAYVAIGLGGAMSSRSGGVDMIIGWVAANGTAFVSDHWSTGHERPKRDVELGGTDDVQAVGGSFADGATTVRFVRKLRTADKFDGYIAPSGPLDLVYAWADGAPGELGFHGDNHNHVMVDLSMADGVPRTSFGDEEVGMGARALMAAAMHGTLITIQSEASAGARGLTGWPYGSVADYADEIPSSGRPLLLLSKLERNVINLKSDGRASLEIHTPSTVANYTDAMMEPRATLLGRLSAVGASELPAARKAYLARHPEAEAWIGFDDFALYVMDVADVYWVGGFGNSHYIGYVGADAYLKNRV